METQGDAPVTRRESRPAVPSPAPSENAAHIEHLVPPPTSGSGRLCTGSSARACDAKRPVQSSTVPSLVPCDVRRRLVSKRRRGSAEKDESGRQRKKSPWRRGGRQRHGTQSWHSHDGQGPAAQRAAHRVRRPQRRLHGRCGHRPFLEAPAVSLPVLGGAIPDRACPRVPDGDQHRPVRPTRPPGTVDTPLD